MTGRITRLLAFGALLSISAGALAAETAPSPAKSDIVARYAPLAGHWSVDLRPSLTDPAYNQPMDITVHDDGHVTGAFYNSDMLAGRVGRGQDRMCLSFRTTDGNGLYHSAACLVGGKLVGQTWAEGRNFVLPWTAER